MKTTGRPLIITAETEHLPRWVRRRDALLTVLLWVGCARMWLQLFPEIQSWFTARASEELNYELPSIMRLLKEGLLLTGGLLVVYYFWSLWTFLSVNRDIGQPVPSHLLPEEEARAYGLPPEDLPALRAHASVTVQTGPDGKVGGWQPGFHDNRPTS